ncbi:MAG TPA: hypothetical protein DCS30_11815 [Rhizobiales bacterium]|nr:hypothetical protein [Hyphomicrobiales bacterium]
MIEKARQLRVFDFVEKIRAVEGDYSAIIAATIDELKWYGLDYLTCTELPDLGQTGQELILANTRPMDYLRNYFEQGHVLRDPVVTELKRTSTPFTWNQVRERRNLSKREKNIIDEGQCFGFNNGMIIPVISETGSIAIFSPCGWDPDLSPDSALALDVVGTFATQALRRCRRRKQRPNDYNPLTFREREILQFVASGKTDDDIADILTISSNTVCTHVQNIKRKLSASNRTYAVYRAIQLGEINF